MKKISAGLIYTNGTEFLICHSNLNKFYDLPKGEIGINESAADACVREFHEEVGIVLQKENIIDLGIYPYMAKKDLHLFLSKKDILVPINLLKCSSTFTRYGKEYLEVDSYKYVSPNNMKLYITNSMYNTLTICFKENKIFKEYTNE